LVSNNEMGSNLEQLLESLIKMVGKANKNVDGLQRRVTQLEWAIKEQQHEIKEKDNLIRIYSSHPHESSENIPFRF
jgi:peptidoglycan hydrolase CwlO-like protein